MKLLRIFSPILVLAFATGMLRAAADPVSDKIDALVEAGYAKNKVTPNAPANDETFLRRIYLDVIGRIPTQEEARTFLESSEAGKRGKLIDQLLASDGYVSNWYNWWADILRVQTGMRDESGVAYAEWIKSALRENRPYDKVVHEMITAKGFIWENGAVGYYVRDTGMPLDNMSNTAQIFLGTRLVCAQCHNHPFDKWTQKDYYEMAAYTYGVDTELNPRSAYRRLAKEEATKGRRMSEREQQAMRRIIDDVLEPLKYGVDDSERMLKLPNDYKYDDAVPGEYVKAKTIFGDKAKSSRDPRGHYAEWLTSPENPRFTLVIANRLWKRAMGMGLVEPVDDFKDGTEPSNPALMKYLTEQIVSMKFDTKAYLRAVYNTKTYQRESTRGEVSNDQPYYFAGPVLRRMTAEQIWDSICALVIPNPDHRVRDNAYQGRLAAMKAQAEQLKACKPQDIVLTARKYAEMDSVLDGRARVARDKLNALREDGDDAGAANAQKELNAINTERDGLVDLARKDLLEVSEKGKSPFLTVSTTPPAGAKKMDAMKDEKAPAPAMPDDSQWKGYGADFYRASELPSPAPGGHFLREFGQSNREVIENGTTEATVSQALNLMNGPVFQQLTMENSVLMQRFHAASNDEGRMNAIFQSLYSRKPTDTEKAIVLETIAEKKKEGWNDVIWALMNSREFVFVQ